MTPGGTRKETWLTLAAYFALALVYLLPLPASWASCIPGDNGDSVPNLWPFWFYPWNLVNNGAFSWHNPWQFAPDGFSNLFASTSILGVFLMAPVSLLFSPAAALNTWLLLHLWLGGWFFNRFCRMLGAGAGAALLGGMAFSWSPFVAVHLPGHYTLVQIAWTGGALWTLAAFVRRCTELDAHTPYFDLRTIMLSVLLGLLCWATAVSDFYLAVMTGYLLAVVLAFLFTVHRMPLLKSGRLWGGLAVAVVIAIVAMIPWFAGVASAQQGHDYSAPVPGMGSHNVATWNRLVSIPAYHFFWSSSFPEFEGKLSVFNEYTYLGMVAFFAACVGMLALRPRGGAIVLVLAFIVALGLAGGNSYTASPAWTGGPLTFGKWWPTFFPFAEFRVPGRWQFVLCTLVALGLALGLTAIASRMTPSRRAILYPLIFAALAFDLLRWPLPIFEARPITVAGLPDYSKERGVLLDVPVGMISGAGHSIGTYERETLLRQMTHAWPVLSVNVSRLPNDLVAARKADPELTAWTTIQDGDTTATDGLAWPAFAERYNIGAVRIPVDLDTSATLQSLANQFNIGLEWQATDDALIGTRP